VSKHILLDSYPLSILSTPIRSSASVPIALTSEFATDPSKKLQWNAFLRKNRINPDSYQLEVVIKDLAAFLQPILNALSEDKTLSEIWKPVTGWQKS
jgi:hypothetical protein